MGRNLLQPRLSQDKICLALWLPKHQVVVPAGCLDCLMCELSNPCTRSIIDYAWKSLQNTKLGLYSWNWSLLLAAEFGNHCPGVIESIKSSFCINFCPASPQPHHYKEVSHILPATSPVSARTPHPFMLSQLHLFCHLSLLTVKEIAHVTIRLMLCGPQDKRSLPFSKSWWNVSLCDTLF